MTTRSRSIAFLIAASLALGACSGASSVPPGGNIELARSTVARVAANPADAVLAGSAINAFGLALYANLAADTPNTVISPASIALALGMARVGAKGQTGTEMDAVLHSLASDANASWLNALDAALAARSGTFKDANGKDLAVALRIANAPFAQKGMAIEPAYLDALASRWGAGLRLVDYINATEAARKAINGWVSDQTEQRIPQLLDPGVLDDMSRLTLVNAIYLKAAWQDPFEASATANGTFTTAAGKTVTVPLMHATTSLRYAKGPGWQAVEIPYIGGSLAMTVILPDDLTAFEQQFNAATLNAITAALGETQVTLTLPKFSIETKAELSALLEALGMPTAFSGGADFSGITTAEKLVISAVIHQANIDVDEKGTTAAAATAVVLRATGMPAQPVTLSVDHPFLFALRDVPTGTVLFLGRVGDPSITR